MSLSTWCVLDGVVVCCYGCFVMWLRFARVGVGVVVVVVAAVDGAVAYVASWCSWLLRFLLRLWLPLPLLLFWCFRGLCCGYCVRCG